MKDERRHIRFAYRQQRWNQWAEFKETALQSMTSLGWERSLGFLKKLMLLKFTRYFQYILIPVTSNQYSVLLVLSCPRAQLLSRPRTYANPIPCPKAGESIPVRFRYKWWLLPFDTWEKGKEALLKKRGPPPVENEKLKIWIESHRQGQLSPTTRKKW